MPSNSRGIDIDLGLYAMNGALVKTLVHGPALGGVSDVSLTRPQRPSSPGNVTGRGALVRTRPIPIDGEKLSNPVRFTPRLGNSTDTYELYLPREQYLAQGVLRFCAPRNFGRHYFA